MKLLESTLPCSMLVAFSAAADAQCLDWADGLRAGGMDDVVSDIAMFDDGGGPRLYACGEFRRASGAAVDYLARWSGSRWEALPVSPSLPVRTLAVRSETGGDVLYVGGTFPGLSSPNIARFDGASWTGLGTGIQGTDVRAIAFFDDGSGPVMYVGGRFNAAGGNFSPGIARWTGTSWSTIGGVLGGQASVNALAVFDDGSGLALYVGGHFESAGPIAAASLARWNGSAWSAVGGGILGDVRALEVHDDGSGATLVAAGSFVSAGGTPASSIARWNGSSWAPLGDGIPTPSGFDGVATLRTFDDGMGGPSSLYAAGAFAIAGGVSAHNIARWSGGSWSALPGEPDGAISRLRAHDDGSGSTLVACGDVLHAGGLRVGRVATWDGASFGVVDAGNAPMRNATDSAPVVRAFATYDDGSGAKLFVAGDFDDAGTIATPAVARWDGASWSSLGGGYTTGEVLSLSAFDDGSGEELYAGGTFGYMSGLPANGLARWNGTAWSFVVGQAGVSFVGNARVGAIVVHDDGSGPALYLGGSFTLSAIGAGDIVRYRNGVWSAVGDYDFDGVRALAVHDDGSGPALYAAESDATASSGGVVRVLEWDGVTWTVLGSGFGNGSGYPEVEALVSHDDGTGRALYAGGTFASDGSVALSNLARWQNGAWSDVGGGVSAGVKALASIDVGSGNGPELFVGGQIVAAGSVSVQRIARWDGASWNTVGSGVTNVLGGSPIVQAIAAWDDGNGRDMYVGGIFDLAGGRPSTNFARWEGCGETGKTFCYGDGSAAACPCGNSSAVGERAGCAHSLGQGGALRGRGEPSIADDSLVLAGGAMPNSSALYFQAVNVSNGGLGVPFGDGIKCTSGPFVRLGSKLNASGASQYPEAGDLSISVKGQIASPATRRYQVRYRNAATFCTADTFNYTNGLEIVWRL